MVPDNRVNLLHGIRSGSTYTGQTMPSPKHTSLYVHQYSPNLELILTCFSCVVCWLFLGGQTSALVGVEVLSQLLSTVADLSNFSVSTRDYFVFQARLFQSTLPVSCRMYYRIFNVYYLPSMDIGSMLSRQGRCVFPKVRLDTCRTCSCYKMKLTSKSYDKMHTTGSKISKTPLEREVAFSMKLWCTQLSPLRLLFTSMIFQSVLHASCQL